MPLVLHSCSFSYLISFLIFDARHAPEGFAASVSYWCLVVECSWQPDREAKSPSSKSEKEPLQECDFGYTRFVNFVV